MSDRKRHGLILLLVAGLIAASAVFIAIKPTRLGLDLKGGVELVYKAFPSPQSPVNQESLARTVDVMSSRVNQLGVTQPQIQTEGNDLIDVQLPDVKNVQEAENTVGNTAQLSFYDWEANVITPSGQVAANGLLASDAASVTLSQGTPNVSAPGANTSSSGAIGFYEAVKLASKQPFRAKGNFAQSGNSFFMFGAPGSAACKALAQANRTTPQKGVHCLISGPVQVEPGMAHAKVMAQLTESLPSAQTSGTEVLEVKQGTQVLQAVPTQFGSGPKYGSPDAGYYVLRDDVALRGSQISNPEQSTDQGGAPDVTFGFKGNGGNVFQSVTAKIAQRGQAVSIGQELDQHFAIALDDQLVTVPSISYKEFPDGIPSSGGSEITGGFTTETAGALATQLRLGALPVKLKQISETQVSATLGSQSLRQGLIAGLVGLAAVMLLLAFAYRVLGLIAIGALIVYGVYFYALIKLIPITLSLAGIAGLVLTIGVAADANVVIFERVKEEIRAGRSIRQGIVTGYRKGLTAIIDANVVTIMTAFILFVLATSDVKGFAFTLGIGTIVSLFTAVLATQAILTTMGESRVIQSPSALGAGQRRRFWRFDFMGASRYFFSLSGVILLVGALAIGGRGLNLGIDFTGGTQISVGLNHAASVNAVKSMVEQVGGGGEATVQAVSGKALGAHGFQIASKYLGRSDYEALRGNLNSHFGVHAFNTTSVGPSFGSAVAHSAVIAIIVSLLAITLYVALRFEWKFTIPVLIALMHDILITAGVYALTGRVVSADTVAALLTILGYSLYDTIIVFDRVRENIPRMPRAAFSQVVNRSMSEVLTRSLITTSCTLLPVLALLLFGGSTLKDFAFALLIGIASGAYSSIFIASPVLTHWKEREHGYKSRRHRIVAELGNVPAYADGGDVEPGAARRPRPGTPLGAAPDAVSNAEFEQMKRDLGLEDDRPRHGTSRIAKRLAHTEDSDAETAGPVVGAGSGTRSARGGRSFTPIPTRRAPVVEKPQPTSGAPEPPSPSTDRAAPGEPDATGERGSRNEARRESSRSRGRKGRHGRKR